MAMNVGSSGKGLSADINVTPLVDVLLVLLIIFMVTVPIVQRGYDIDIPKENVTAAPQPQDQKQIILGINETDCPATTFSPTLPPGCLVRINKDGVRIDALAQKIATIMDGRKRSDKILFIAAQEKMNYSAVIQIVDLARSQAQDVQIGIVTDESLAFGGGDKSGTE